ncbi:class I SAM-dependent methyltransferase [Ensifer sp. ENS12]|uniref:class I SAM-dependent methyltransferase n=1 Tax=Ensifer sp. ENS12 TaxID=2854774 RepID=UPI001C45DC58|nr:class I SAM-dependent methyltransferase [Ensifer sp. ENS12]MBV7520396.1 hypothetical protein [Ensifer sp. ENS12]
MPTDARSKESRDEGRRKDSRLEKLLFRLEAQRICLEWAFWIARPTVSPTARRHRIICCSAGDIEDTLASGATRFGGQVILAHADMGSYVEANNIATSAKLSRCLPAVLSPHAIILSDLPLELAGTRSLPRPPGAPKDTYFLYVNGPP